MKDVNVAFFLISSMTIALYLIMYMLMYAAAIRLRYSQPDLPRLFRIPGGTVGMWIVSGIGFVGVAFSFMLSFVPPAQLPVGNPSLYVTLVTAGAVVFTAIPFVIHMYRKPSGPNEWPPLPKMR
jgi:amino acid transporter